VFALNIVIHAIERTIRNRVSILAPNSNVAFQLLPLRTDLLGTSTGPALLSCGIDFVLKYGRLNDNSPSEHLRFAALHMSTALGRMYRTQRTDFDLIQLWTSNVQIWVGHSRIRDDMSSASIVFFKCFRTKQNTSTGYRGSDASITTISYNTRSTLTTKRCARRHALCWQRGWVEKWLDRKQKLNTLMQSFRARSCTNNVFDLGNAISLGWDCPGGS
jgi:hypothetical protein